MKRTIISTDYGEYVSVEDVANSTEPGIILVYENDTTLIGSVIEVSNKWIIHTLYKKGSFNSLEELVSYYRDLTFKLVDDEIFN